MIPSNPFDYDSEDLMPSPYASQGSPKVRIYKFLPDGTTVEASTSNGYNWTMSVTDPDGKVVLTRSAYSETAARAFVEEYQ